MSHISNFILWLGAKCRIKLRVVMQSLEHVASRIRDSIFALPTYVNTSPGSNETGFFRHSCIPAPPKALIGDVSASLATHLCLALVSMWHSHPVHTLSPREEGRLRPFSNAHCTENLPHIHGDHIIYDKVHSRNKVGVIGGLTRVRLV